MDYTVYRILQARILEWVAFPFSRGSSQPSDRTQVSHVAEEPGGLWGRKESDMTEQLTLSTLNRGPKDGVWNLLP